MGEEVAEEAEERGCNRGMRCSLEGSDQTRGGEDDK